METQSFQSLRFGPDISGYVQLKRKLFWVLRFAEIQNGVFYYYEEKDNTRPRGAFRLTDCKVTLQISSDGQQVINIDIKPKNSDPVIIQMKTETKQERQNWMMYLKGGVNQSARIPSQVGLPVNSNSIMLSPNNLPKPDIDFFDDDLVSEIGNSTPPTQSPLQKQESEESNNLNSINLNPEIKISPSSTDKNSGNKTVVSQASRTDEFNPISTKFNKKIVDPTLFQSNLPSAQRLQSIQGLVKTFLKDFNRDREVLSEIDQDLKVFSVFLGYQKQSNVVKRPMSFIKFLAGLSRSANKVIQRVQEQISPALFWEMALGSMIALCVILYPFLNSLNSFALWFSLFLIFNITVLPFIINLEYQELNDDDYDEQQDLDVQNNPGSSARKSQQRRCQFFLRSEYFFPYSINQFLFIMKQVNLRKQWQPAVTNMSSSGNSSPETLTITYGNFQNTEKEEFVQSTYKEQGQIMFVEHDNTKVIRLFEIHFDQTEWQGFLVNYYVKSPEKTIFHNIQKTFAAPPSILRGLTYLIKEQRRNNQSFLSQYLSSTSEKQVPIEEEKERKEEIKEPLQQQSAAPSQAQIEQKQIQKFPEDQVFEDQSGAKFDLRDQKKTVAPEYLKFYQLGVKAQKELEKQANLNLEENKWKFSQKTQKDITVHTSIDAVSGNLGVRGQGIIPLNIDKLTDFIIDLPRRGQYDELFESGQRVINFCEILAVVLQQFKPKWPVQSRDFLMISGVLKSVDRQKYYIVAQSVDESENQIKMPAQSTTRGELIIAGWILEKIDETKTQGVYVVLSDPKGNIPKTIKDYAAQQQAYSVENIVILAEKGKI